MCELCEGLFCGQLCIVVMSNFGWCIVVLLLYGFCDCYLEIVIDLMLDDCVIDFSVNWVDFVFCDGCLEDSQVVVW